MAKHERYGKHARKGGHPLKAWIVERPFDSADYLDGPPPTYAAPTPPTTPNEGGAVSAVSEAAAEVVQEGLRDAAASRERWRKWELAHGLENHAAPYQVKAGAGGMFHVHNAETGGGKSLPMTAKDAHARATELNQKHVADLTSIAPAGVQLGTTRTADGQHMVTVGRVERRSRFPQGHGVVARPSQDSTPASKATSAAAHAASQPGYSVQLTAAKRTAVETAKRIGEDAGVRVGGRLIGWMTPTGKFKPKTQEAEMGAVEEAVREVLEAKVKSKTVACPNCGTKNTIDAEDLADGGEDEKAEGDKPLVCSKCGKSLTGALAKAARDSGATSISEAADSMAKASSPEPFSSSTTSNWVARGGGLPAYIQHIAHDLMEKRGKSESNAIQMAIGIVKNWASGKGNVDANTRAAASKAVAEWEALKAKNKAKSVKEAAELAAWEPSGMEPSIVQEAEAILADAVRLHAIQEAKTTADGDGPSNEDGIKVKCMACGKRGIPTKDANCSNCGKDVSKALAFAKRIKGKAQESADDTSPVGRAIQEGLAES